MNIALFEDSGCLRLLPLTWLRACFELRCGCDRLVDKVRRQLGRRVARVWVRESIQAAVGERFEPDPAHPDEDWCVLNARTLVTGSVRLPPPGVAWQQNGELVAAGVFPSDLAGLTPEFFLESEAVDN